MMRFCGMMPASEVEKRSVYTDRYGDEVRIDAGPNGWTVYYCDMSTRYKDESIGTDANFKNAYKCANEEVGPLKKRTRKNEACEVDVDD